MPNPMESLQTLMRLRGPSNVGAVRSNRGLDVLTGMDQFEPSENELIDEQASNPMVSGPYMNFRSRESIRDTGMQNVRKMLGLGAIEHAQKVEQAERPVRLKGEFDLEAADRNLAAEQVGRQSQQDAIRERAEQDRQFRAEQNQLSREHSAALQDDRQAAPTRPAASRVTDGALRRLEDVRRPGGLRGMLGLGPSQAQLKASLESVLEQRGSLGDIAAAARDFAAGTMTDEGRQWLATLEPFEAEYFKILTGQ